MAKHRFDEVDDRFKWGGPALLGTWSHVPGAHGSDHEGAAALEPSAELREAGVRPSSHWRRRVARGGLAVVPRT